MILPLVAALVVGQLIDPQQQPGEGASRPDAAGPAISEPSPSPAPPEPEEIDRSKQTVVTASRAERKLEDVVVATEVITRKQIEAVGARDLGQLLQQHPGVELVQTFRGTGLRLQGLDPEYVLVLVDGERVSGRVGTTLDLGRFSLRDVERVEIVKGPAAALYGADAIGGVVNLISRRVQRPLELSARGSFGALLEGDFRANAGTKQGPFEVRVGGSYRTRSPYDWAPADAATSGAGIRRFDGDVALAYAPDERSRLWLRSQYNQRDENAVDLNPSGAVLDRRQRQEQFDLSLGGRKQLADDTSLLVRGHFGLFRDQLLQDQRGSRALDDYSQNFNRLYEGVIQADHRMGHHAITGGIEVLGERLSSARLEESPVGRIRGGAFLQDEWDVALSSDGSGPKLKVAPGFRFDLDSQFGGAPSPRLALKLDPIPALTARASVGLGFRPPSFQELYLRFSNQGIGYVVAGNRNLTAERSAAVNVGLDWRPPIDGWIFSVSGFHTRLNNLINVTASGVPNPDDPVTYNYENVARAYTQGLELNGHFRLPVRATYLDLSYTRLDAKDVTRDRPLEGRARHRVNAQLSTRVRPLNLEATVRGSWVGGRPYYLGTDGGMANVIGLGEEEEVWAPSYFDLEAQVTYKLKGGFEVFVNGYNLLNAGDQRFNPRTPRGVLGGVQWEY
ncbi:TonB-dependent receptor [Archangium violaceum]|uniref:TonB-dependent receptor plug domain-containing protein n=1 Tax=Archangium violaceum TaxID=83451 RepID=UPI00193C0A74|nr:TonB-dependent receptor [Archangium violaceum]QRK04993.1 TonB-dependent receptor [Archangium violaceum]